ncbi:hypothetical protein PybrP1_012136 [[Pythium] brassicae (nom. inval.)]|nr:hypothetical protein PybrP1_012136 [[Pythium] brassicae (nom. inval.)]
MAGDDEPARVLPHVFLGSKAHARDRELLARLQITHVLNVTPPRTVDPVAGVPNFFEKDKTLTYKRCPIFDNKAEDLSGLLEGCVAFIEQAKYYGRILVHCNKGVSRSSSVVVAYLMKSSAMGFERALRFVVDKRPIVNPNASFRRQLEDYGEKLRREAAAAASKSKHGGATRTVGVRGPQGPSSRPSSAIGPQLPPSTGGASERDAPRPSGKEAIGPQLPPHLLKRQQQEGEEEEEEEEEEEVGDAENASGDREAAISPSFPPRTRKRRRDAAADSSDAASPAPTKAARGD